MSMSRSLIAAQNLLPAADRAGADARDGVTKLYIVFINHEEFNSTSGIHIYQLGKHFAAAGIGVTAYVPGDPATIQAVGDPAFETASFSLAHAINRIRGLKRSGIQVLLHAWTPRERVRKFASRLARYTEVPYFVHLEDNEPYLAQFYTRPRAKLSLRSLYKDWQARQNLTDSKRMNGFLSKAAGITCITEKLLEHCPENVPQLEFWPGCEEAFFHMHPEPDADVRATLGISWDEFVIVYPGATYPANFEDMVSLYDAVAGLHRRGMKIRLVRLGGDHPTSTPRFSPSQLRPWLIHLGERPARELPYFLAAADALVQPGKADAFNDYRFPGKLTLFLASGRPVILPRANIGKHLTDGQECLLLETGASAELATRLELLMANTSLRRRIGLRGREFARRHFWWPAIAERLLTFYRTHAEAPLQAADA